MHRIYKALKPLVPNRWKPWMRRLLSRSTPTDQPSNVSLAKVDDYYVVYRRGTADEQVIAHSFSNDIFLTSTLADAIRSDDVVLDIGAHIGTFSLLASRRAANGRVIAIEACRDTHTLLEINAKLNSSTNLVPVQCALSNQNGRQWLSHAPGNWGNSLVVPRQRHGEEVQTMTLARLLEEQHISQVGFAKFNCEGSEFPILLSTPASTLACFRTMLVLYHCDMWTHNSLDDLLLHLQRAGFHCSVTRTKPLRGWIIAQQPLS